MSDVKNEIAVMGLGNPFMSDEGIGVKLVTHLRDRKWVPQHIDVLDMGTTGMGVLHAMTGRRKVIFIDCALMGEPPGTLRRFTPEQAVSRKVQTRLSLHEGDLLHTIRLAGQTDDGPKEIIIFGIQPAKVGPGEELTPTLSQRFDDYIEVLLQELAMASSSPT